MPRSSWLSGSRVQKQLYAKDTDRELMTLHMATEATGVRKRRTQDESPKSQKSKDQEEGGAAKKTW